MIYIYKILTLAAFIIALPVLPLLCLVSTKRRATLLPRLGYGHPDIPVRKRDSEGNGSKSPRFWIHALSVGEVRSSVPLVRAVKERFPDGLIIFTASTKTGMETARELFQDTAAPLVEQTLYFPLDLGVSIRRTARLIDPDLVVLVETDLWPNFLHHMKHRRVPVILANARLSNRSLDGYLKVKPFSRLFFSFLTRILAQTREDRARYLELGIAPETVAVTGNIKFDQPFESMAAASVDQIKKQLNIPTGSTVVLAGSTHPGEESILADWYNKEASQHPGLCLIIAPRNPDRCTELKREFRSQQVLSALLSEIESSSAGYF